MVCAQLPFFWASPPHFIRGRAVRGFRPAAAQARFRTASLCSAPLPSLTRGLRAAQADVECSRGAYQQIQRHSALDAESLRLPTVKGGAFV
jgi:hypothetical protein